MLFLKLLTAIASLFVIYPFIKFIRRYEVNIFDLIIIFHTVFFCFIPLFSDFSAFQWLKGFSFEDNIIFRIFIYYIIFITLLLITDVFWTKHYKYRRSILNISYYLKTFPQVDISWVFLGLLFINLIISWFWYLPQASYFEAFDKFSQSQGYVLKSPLYLLYGTIFTLCFSFALFLYLRGKLSQNKYRILILILFGFALLLLFLPRRMMLFYCILSLLIIYSLKRNLFTNRSIIGFAVVFWVILKIYFPFYNIMRNSKMKIDKNNYTTSLVYIVEDAKNSFNSKRERAAEKSEGRALNLYYALYRIIKYDKFPSNGGLFIAAVDHALPKIINPNKGAGTAKILENKMQCKTDQADSILLLGYGDFGLFVGAFYSCFIFILIICLHVFLELFNLKFFHNGSTIGLLLVVYLISFSWNVESPLDGRFVSVIHLTIMSIILMLLSQFDIIGYKKNHK